MNNLLGNKRKLSSIIGQIVEESLKSSLYKNSVEEKDRQKEYLDEDDDLDDVFSDTSKKGDKKSGEDKPSDTSSKTLDADREKLKKGNITADDIVDRLNSIRGGKSFKDEAIAARLNEYVDSLSKAEKVALLAFLKALSQIVTGEVPADQTIDPEDAPANVKMEKGTEEKKSVKPNVIKAPEKKKEAKPAEDTSAPVPITPKKK